MTAAAKGSPHDEHAELTSASAFTVLHAGHATVTVFALVLVLIRIESVRALVVGGVFFVVPDLTEGLFRELRRGLNESALVPLRDEVYEVLDFRHALGRQGLDLFD